MASFRVLGPIKVFARERELPVGGRRQLTLLAYLLLHANQAVSSDAVSDAVWGASRAAGDNRLQMAIARLRKALEPVNDPRAPRLRTVGGGYLLSVDPDELDTQLFAEKVRAGRAALDAGDAVQAAGLLDDALALWRGPPLAEVAFEDFVQSEIRRLEELRQVALEAHVDARLRLGQHREVIGELQALLAEHPDRERLAGQLMLALYRAGRQGDALETYQRTRAHLASELGLEPGPALQTLQAQILEHDPVLQPPTLDAVPPAATASPNVSSADRGWLPDRPTAPVVGDEQAGLPAGTVTFMVTDIEGSTRLLKALGPDRYAGELGRHRDRVREIVAAHCGWEFGTHGDAFAIAFARASEALKAAGELQAGFVEGPVRVRVGVHTGEPLVRFGDYVGLDVHKAARICDAAHGGQVLVSRATHDLAADGLHELGEFRLKDLTAPERLFQLGNGEFPPPRTLRPTNLPVQPGPLLGRRRELAELEVLARTSRLVTLTGPGGAGKTRLALELVARLTDEYQDGAWWVPLAAVTDPSLVLGTIAQRLGARGEPQEHLAGRHVLLLLDNLEQVLDCAPALSGLLAALPQLSVIATSRERLAISFEQEYPIGPLDGATAEELFVSRARQLEPGFQPDETVGEICERLDRLPLALELASTRVKLMSTAQMLDRIEQRLDLLSKGKRDAHDRQATMRATIGWSYDLLSEAEQALVRGLGVFASSFELAAAEAVCGADLDDLQSLIEKSLLRRDALGRYFLLELTREYALEQLRASGEEGVLRQRHAEWFLQLAKRADEHLRSADERRWLADLEPDTDNFRAALAWCSEHDPAGTVELATTLNRPWRMHGRHPELSSWLERALATPATLDARTRAAGLRTLGDALNFSGEYNRARAVLEQSLALFSELGDESGEASVLVCLGMVFANQGPVARGIELHEAAIAISRRTGDTLTTARGLNFLAGCLLSSGELERSAAAYEQALAIYTDVGWQANAANQVEGLADIALVRGDAEEASRLVREVLDLVRGHDDERQEMYAVAGLACAAALRGDSRSAGRLWAIAEAAENRPGMAMVSDERARYERIIRPVQNDQAFQAGYQAGLDIKLADAIGELRTAEEPSASLSHQSRTTAQKARTTPIGDD